MTTSTAACWSAAGLTVHPAAAHVPDLGLVAEIARHKRAIAVLSPELVRSLRDWCSWWLDDDGQSPPPADPDPVRVEIDVQRAELRQQSAEAGVGDAAEHYRAGLAWADRALDAIAAAAGEPA